MARWIQGDGAAMVAVLSGTVLGPVLLPSTLPFLAVEPKSSAPTSPAADPAPSLEPVAFHATSFGMGWGLEGDYAGALSRISGELRADLSLATVRATHAADEGTPADSHLVGIRLALAEEGPAGWRIVREGPTYGLDRLVTAGSRLTLEGVTLTLPDVSEAELVDRWLVIVHELAVREEDGSTSTAWSYAHADPDLLPRLMEWIEDGC
jgi:hypothetical protein